MGQPAARVGDPVAHPSPPVLTGSPGSPNVIIGKKPAWRGMPGVGSPDIHQCTTPLPPSPHGPGIVMKGSLTVLINKLAACRQGDQIIEAAPPNMIMAGCPTVLIGG